MMSSEADKYIGSVVSAYCDDGSCLQGQLVSINQNNGTIELKRPFKNGRQMKEPTISLCFAKILSLKLLKMNDQLVESNNRDLQDNFTEVDDQRNGSSAHSPHSELDSLSVPAQQATSSLPYSSSTSPTRFSSSYKSNGFLRNERWSTRNGTDAKFPRYPAGSLKCNGKRATHGCGDPVLDAEKGFWVSRHNRHLLKPIDFETLTTDFDFEGNLALFDKVAVEMEENGHHFRRLEEKNYKHYENVITDPSRVTSWTTASSRYNLDDGTNNTLYTAAHFVTTEKGIKIPFLSYEDKQNYLSIAESFLGSDVFHVQIADRLLMFLWTIIDRFEVMVDELVVLTSPIANPLLLNRFAQHFSNRACKTVIFGDDSVVLGLPYVRHVNDPRDLPVGEGRFVVALDGHRDNPDLNLWASRLPRQTHLMCLEQPRKLCTREHVLMIGVGTDMRNGASQGKDEEGLLGVTDMGIPFAWLDVHSAACMATAFATEMIVIL